MKKNATLIICSPRGFCAGVERAIQAVMLALQKYGKPVYVRHEIVHNKYVVQNLQEQGAIFVESLDEIPDTKQPVIFSAHGVPKNVPEKAKKKNLFFLDATCPLVSKVHKQAMLHHKKNRQVVLVGHKGHPEVVGTMGQLPEGKVTLVENVEDVKKLEQKYEEVGYVTQTTLSVDDTQEVINALKNRFKKRLVAPAAESICYATTNRQNAVKNVAPKTDMFIVVGAENSSNSKRLVEVAAKAQKNPNAMLVTGERDLPWEKIEEIKNPVIGLSAGASAPEKIVQDIIETLRERFNLRIEVEQTIKENQHFPVMKEIRDVEPNQDLKTFG